MLSLSKHAKNITKNAEKNIAFQQFIIKHRKLQKYDLNNIGNVDQTPVHFDIIAKKQQ